LLITYFNITEACTLTISDSSARGTGASAVVNVNGQDIGTLLEATELSSTRAALIGRSYIDRNVSASGTCSGSTPVSYNLTLKKGWNLVFVADAVGGGLTVTTDLPAPSPEDTQFFLLPISDIQDILHTQPSIQKLLEQSR
jgi:hypothetical protein